MVLRARMYVSCRWGAPGSVGVAWTNPRQLRQAIYDALEELWQGPQSPTPPNQGGEDQPGRESDLPRRAEVTQSPRETKQSYRREALTAPL